MKSNRTNIQNYTSAAAAVALVAGLITPAFAQDKGVVVVDPNQLQTQKDIPQTFHKYFGQRVNSWRDRERAIAKIDFDADMNQDGMIQNDDPADSGAFEGTPPGLILGKGELSRFVIRLLPYRVDFDGEVVVTLEVEGINRGDKSGEFASLDEELATMGHVRVYRDQAKKELLLDSRDPAKRAFEFTTDYKTYPYNLPLAVPRVVYVEGVSPSPIYTGDIRLLVTVSHRAPGEVSPYALTASKEPLPLEPEKKIGIKSFRTNFDHILVTVQPKPVAKEFINNNNEGVWLAPAGTSY